VVQAADLCEEDDVGEKSQNQKPKAAFDGKENTGAEDHTDDQVDQTTQKKLHARESKKAERVFNDNS
jgi:hypothetical protein